MADYYLVVRVSHDRKRINPTRLARQVQRAIEWTCGADVSDTELLDGDVEDVRVKPAPADMLPRLDSESFA